MPHKLFSLFHSGGHFSVFPIFNFSLFPKLQQIGLCYSIFTYLGEYFCIFLEKELPVKGMSIEILMNIVNLDKCFKVMGLSGNIHY